MKMVIKFLRYSSILLLLILLHYSAFSQVFTNEQNDVYPYENAPLDLNMEVGTSFSTGFNGSSFLTHSISPMVLWNTSNRLTIETGTIFSSTAFTGSQISGFTPGFSSSSDNMSIASNNLYRNISYTMGYYNVNENLTIRGGAYMDLSNFNNQITSQQMNPQAFNLDAKGMIMGFDYQLNEKVSIGAEINVRSGQSPYQYMQGNNPFASPYRQQSPFHRNTIR